MNKKLILFSLLAVLALSGCDGSSWSKTINPRIHKYLNFFMAYT